MHNSGEGGSYDLKDRNWAQGEECGGHGGGVGTLVGIRAVVAA